MITGLRIIYGDSCDPYRNLAVEQVLLESVREDECILYLWQNQRTVVIGRNQNAWRECRLSELRLDGGHLARRLSGGGAVYHDLGNLNFTFVLHKTDFDTTRQLSVVAETCRSLHIPAEISGRNDVLADGRKFSGNAFYDSAGKAYHHGTLLIDADMGALAKYLRPSRAKLEAKGVESVRARVVNLRELVPSLTAEQMRQAMASAFETVYGMNAVTLDAASLDQARISELTARNGGWPWLLGQRLPFTCSCEGRFPWGELQIDLQVEHGVIADLKVWSDALDHGFAQPLEAALRGARLDHRELNARLSEADGAAADIREGALRLLTEQVL